MNWEAVGAIGQVVGAAATFGAVVVSLYLARRSRRPILKVSAAEWTRIDEYETEQLMAFSVINIGERPVEIRSIGWRTGWLRWGPSELRFRYAVQMFEPRHRTTQPPYNLTPGTEVSSYVGMANLLEHAERFGRTGPLFTRTIPFGGVVAARTVVELYTADGFRIRGSVAETALAKLADAERQGRNQTASDAATS